MTAFMMSLEFVELIYWVKYYPKIEAMIMMMILFHIYIKDSYLVIHELPSHKEK